MVLGEAKKTTGLYLRDKPVVFLAYIDVCRSGRLFLDATLTTESAFFRSFFDDEQVDFQGHLSQIMLPRIDEIVLVFPQFQLYRGAECGMPLYIVLYFQ